MAAVQAAGPDPTMTTFSGMVHEWAVGSRRSRAPGRVAAPGRRAILDGHPGMSGSAVRRQRIGVCPPPTAHYPLLPMHERLTHFREILRYVPRFRDRVFVIALDGAVVEDENFPNLLLDIALLRSLSIRVALVHGAAHQIRRYAEVVKMAPSDLDGTG